MSRSVRVRLKSVRRDGNPLAADRRAYPGCDGREFIGIGEINVEIPGARRRIIIVSTCAFPSAVADQAGEHHNH